MNLPKTYNHDYISALKAYCFNQFRDINIILRYDIGDKEEFDKKTFDLYGKNASYTSNTQYNEFAYNIFLLDRMFENLSTNEELVVYRRFNPKFLPNIEIGQSYIDKGFVSTSLTKNSLKRVLHSDINKCNSIAKIRAPIGTRCVFVGDDFYRKEDELLLDRGLEFILKNKQEDYYEFEIIKD